MKKPLLLILAISLLTILPPITHANEINIELESSGRLEYYTDNIDNPEIVIVGTDLTALHTKLTEYEEKVRKSWLEAFQYNGINFDDEKTAKLQSTGLSWKQLTVFDLANGLRSLPKSNLVNGNNTNITVDVNNKITLPNASILDNPDIKLTLPKGWVSSDITLDLSEVYKKGAMDALTKKGAEKYYVGASEKWIHDGETLTYPGDVVTAVGWPQPASWVGTHNQKITLSHNGEGLGLVSWIKGSLADANNRASYLEINGNKVTYHGVGSGTVCRLWVNYINIQ